MLLFPNALCCSLDERNCVCAVTKILKKFLPANNFCQLLRVTRKRSCTSAGNAQAQLHFRDDQQRAFGISNISNSHAGCLQEHWSDSIRRQEKEKDMEKLTDRIKPANSTSKRGKKKRKKERKKENRGNANRKEQETKDGGSLAFGWYFFLTWTLIKWISQGICLKLCQSHQEPLFHTVQPQVILLPNQHQRLCKVHFRTDEAFSKGL